MEAINSNVSASHSESAPEAASQPATDRGRYQTLYIATATDGEWLIRRSLGAGEPHENVWETVATVTLQGAIAARRQATNPIPT